MSDTPIHDSMPGAQPVTDAPDATLAAEPQTVAPEVPVHDDEDVKALLERPTADGPGTDNFDALPESDTTFDVEEELK